MIFDYNDSNYTKAQTLFLDNMKRLLSLPANTLFRVTHL